MVVALYGAGVLVLLLAVAWGLMKGGSTYDSHERGEHISFAGFVSPVLLGVVGLVWLLMVGSITATVPGHGIAVIENTYTGQYSTLGPGTHVWPMEPKLTPFITKVKTYSLRPSDQQMELGKPTAPEGEDKRPSMVQADSASPGRPVVYFWVRAQASPVPENIVRLHRRYGPDYVNNWVVRIWASSIKSVQGGNQYDYVGLDRNKFEEDVRSHLEASLVDTDGTPLVFITDVVVEDYEYSDATNAFLQGVQKVEFDRQQAEQEIAVNKKKQEADQVAVETSYIVETRNAERDKTARITRAEGEAQEVQLHAQAEANKIQLLAEAEANGIVKVQAALASAGQGYLEYQRNLQWNGQLPQYMLGNGGVMPFIDLTPQKEQK